MAASSSITTFKYSPAGLPIFEGENYDFWSTQMRTLFILEDLWDLVENSYESPQSQESAWPEARKEKLKEHEMKDAKALYYIQQAITKSIAPRIMAATKSKEAWEVLKNEFQGSAKVIDVKLRTLWTEFDNLAMKEGESIQTFFLRVFSIIYQLKACGGIIQDERVVEKVLRSLPIKYNRVMAAIKESTNLSTLSLHELMGSLQVDEKRMNRFSDQPLEQAFQTKMKMSENKDGENEKQNQGNQFQRRQSNRGPGRGGKRYTQQTARGISQSESRCKFCKNTNHGSMDCHFQKCTRCKNPNHLEKDCWFRIKDEANFSEKRESSNQQFYPYMNTQQEAQDTRYIDSRCSNHMTGNNSSFVSLDEGVKSKVKFGDVKVQNIEGKGTIAVQTKGVKTAMEASTSSEANFQIPASSCIPLSVPSGDEVDSAISGFTSFLQSDAGSKVSSLPLISSLDGLGKLQSVEGMTIQKAFELMNRVKPIQNLIKAIATNEEMWNAFININEVQEFVRQLKTGAKRPEAITSGNQQTQGISYSQQQLSGVYNIVTNPSSNPQTHNHSSQQWSSDQQEGVKPDAWEKILLEFFRIGKKIFKFLFRKDGGGGGGGGGGRGCGGGGGHGRGCGGGGGEVPSDEYLEVAFLLSIVLMLAIRLMRFYV
ncbi:uncharacterized protein LOC114292553 [Camellia sinensis]|uniref:uncharacterized protein LOC114292553 n=1 Tax=Camellia sinensis TaxID=4442 RepID=UPI001036040D|nr:uncharacterized protein LOC114292553 [Camellia sinensis]XP_028092340.1 uncharacterized protein LOC114292553 [Camellia sinensis]